MAKQTRLVAAAALMLALQAAAVGQTAGQTAPSATSPAQDVQRLAPQLVTFAGSDANFQNLVIGLSQGIAVTLTSVTADGFLQTVTFVPASALSVTDIARVLEAARQQLIARGVPNPTAEQIGVTLVGGTLPTPSGAARVNGLTATQVPGGVQPGAFRGAPRPPAPVAGAANPPSNLVIEVRPLASQPLTPGASTGTSASPVTSTSASPVPGTAASPATGTSAGTVGGSPVVRFTSDNTRLGNTSDSPLPPSTSLAPSNTSGTPAAPAPTINPSTGVSNGAPSPAVQLQGRR